MAGIPNPESVADHSFRTAMLTMLMCDELSNHGIKIDGEKAIKMALLHDVPESVTTDIPLTASQFVRKNERMVVKHMLHRHDMDEYEGLWDEYERGTSIEGELVKFADRLEMLLQALEYEKAGFKGLDEFWGTVEELRSSELYGFFESMVEEIVDMHREVLGCS